MGMTYRRGAVWWVWGALAALAVGVVFVANGHELLLLVLTVDTTLLAVLLGVTWSDTEPGGGVAGGASARRRARSGRPRR